MSIVQPLSLLLSLLLVVVAGCQSADKKGPLLKEAAAFHAQATDIQEALEPQIERIDSLKAVLATQKTFAAIRRIATLDSLKTAFAEWEKNLVEVPGMPHNHDHSSKHQHHTDATLSDLPADQMRDLQREILNNVKTIQARFEAVKP